MKSPEKGTTPKDNETLRLPALTPASLTKDQLRHYEQDFERVFSDSSIRNVALSGPYGAGKSSVMKSWCRMNSSHKALFISLTHFSNGVDDSTKDGNLNGQQRRELEWRLINQLVHKTDLKKAPKSRFRSTRDTSIWFIVASVLAFAAILVTTLALENFEALGVGQDVAPNLKSALALARIASITLVSVLALCYVMRHDLASRFLRKLRFMNVEAELDDGKGDALIDKYLDDILYLLGSLDEDIVVFEDLDRYDSLAPFEELREINDLVNEARLARRCKKQPLRFFYLVRDGLFRDPYERTKFFDYIIPVIPFVDPDNSQALLATWLRELGIEPSEELMFALAHYIDDPRILYNIVTEARHYNAVLFNGQEGEVSSLAGTDADKLVALLAYKAFFPNDYELLQRGRGFVCSVLGHRESLITDAVTSLKERLANLDKERMSIELTIQQRSDEIAMMYLWTRSQARPSIGYWEVNNKLSAAKTPKEWLDIVYSDERASMEWARYRDEKLSDDPSYQEQLNLLGDAAKERLKTIDNESARLRRKVQKCRSSRISELIADAESNGHCMWESDNEWSPTVTCSRDEAESVLGSRHFPLLKLLISRGWIDESYPRYVSTFREGDLTFEDRELLKSIRSGSRIGVETEVDNPVALLRHLEARELGSPNAWNYDIAGVLFAGDGTQEQLFSLTETLSGEDALGFVVRYCLSDKFDSSAWRCLMGVKYDPIGRILEGGGDITADELRAFCQLALISYENLELASPSSTYAPLLRRIAEGDREFLVVRDENDLITSLARGLQSIGFEASDISIETVNPVLLKVVCDMGLIAADATLVDSLLNRLYDIKDCMRQGRLAEGILRSGSQGLRDVVERNPDRFLRTMLTDSHLIVRDESKAITWIANCYEGRDDIDLLNNYAGQVFQSRVEDISSIRDTRCAELIVANLCMANTGDNVLKYMSLTRGVVDDNLAFHLETEGIPSDLREACAQCESMSAEDVILALARSKKLPEEKLTQAATAIGIVFESVDQIPAKDIGENRLAALCAGGALKHTSDNLTVLARSYPSAMDGYASTDPERFVDLLERDGTLLEEGCIVSQLHNPSIPIAAKMRLLGLYETIPLDGDYDDEVLAEIIRTHIDDENMSQLPSLYQSAGPISRKAIENRFAKLDVEAFYNISVPLPLKLTQALLERSQSRSHGYAKRLIASQLSYMSKTVADSQLQEVTQLCEVGGLANYARFIGGGRPRRTIIANLSADDESLTKQLVRLGICTVIDDNGKKKLKRT